MEKKYSPQKFEDNIYKLWQKSKAFTPKRDKAKTPFSIIMPPPNSNAPLHIGHAMFVTLQDILTRFHRMKGDVSLLLPGADHAGILTQVVFERHLAKTGKTRFDLGRKKFYSECYKFSQANKKIMYSQIKKLAASCDWTKEKFTLDKKISKTVMLTFQKLYQDGLAYRGKRLINWCPRCMTALSDLEIEHKEIRGKFYYIKYPLKTRSSITDEKIYLVVATTRPETMFGDTALAINPKDNRYTKFIGGKVILPICKREIPIISDPQVDPEFGTGVVKVTPAHDPLDWQIGQKYKLDVISVIDYSNKMTEKAGKEYCGLGVLEARKKIQEFLNSQNLLIKVRTHGHAVGHCERCKTIIEPLVSKQWFISTNKKFKIKNKKLKKILQVNQASLQQLGVLAVKKNLIKIIPKRFIKNYYNWFKNLQDWCVSRQLWWGHQLPVWYCGTKGLSELQKQMNPKLAKSSKEGCGRVIVTLAKPKSCPKCKKINTIIQDPDIFDAWFSSSQWPFTTLGFPKNPDYKYFYPTSVMETGYEILFFWVARMIMIGLYRTHSIPFKTVYLHGLVRDAFGEKMSKSKGNAIDPLKIISEYGADALRMTLVVGSTPGNDLSLNQEKIIGYRNFANKVWNIARFLNISFKFAGKKIPWYKASIPNLTLEDKKILKKLNQLIGDMTNNLETFKFSLGGEAIYQFIWHEFADVYIESSKQRIRNNDITALSVLRHVFLTSLKLLHPFMPFVTEALWQQMPRKNKKLLITSSWPEADK